VKPRVVTTARGPVEVAEVGSGPTIVGVHGLPGDWRQARPVAEDLGGEARVLLVSRPGYGRTPLRSGRSPQDQAALYAALLDALGIEQAVVLGISGGGPSAYAFAAAHHDRCVGLLLCCALTPHLMALPTGMRRLAAVPGLWRVLAALGRQLGRLKTTADLTGFTPTELALVETARADLDRFTRERRHALRGAGMRNDALHIAARREIPWGTGPMGAGPIGTSHSGTSHSGTSHSGTSHSGTSTVPTIVLHGDTDEIVPLEHGQHYADAIPGARLEVLVDHGHAVPLFARSRVAELLRELLSSAPDRPRQGRGRTPGSPPPCSSGSSSTA
jgi:pimeloyl-ACP methyl ester carboxylesterase